MLQAENHLSHHHPLSDGLFVVALFSEPARYGMDVDGFNLVM